MPEHDPTFTAVMKAAHIPMNAYDTNLRSLDTNGKMIAEYLMTDAYKSDRLFGIGAVVYGQTVIRSKMFSAMARAVALLYTKGVIYISMPTLMLAVTEDNHPMTEKIAGTKCLFVANAYDHSVPMPLTGEQRMFVEEYLRQRTESKLCNFYSMSKPLLEAEWWSESFRIDQNAASKSFAA